MNIKEFEELLKQHLEAENKNLAEKILLEGLARHLTNKKVTKVKLINGITITLEADKKRLQQLAGILKPKK